MICDHVSLQTVSVLPAAPYIGNLALRTAVAFKKNALIPF